MDGIDQIMDELERYAYDTDEFLVKRLRDSVDISDFTEIIKLTDNYMN